MPFRPSNNRPLSEMVVDYLEDRLSDDERYALEQQRLRDPDTRAALDGLRASGLSTDELKQDLKQIRRNWRERDDRSVPSRSVYWGWVAAAAFVILAVWSGWGYYQDQRPSRLYADFFAYSTEQEAYFALRGETTTPNPERLNAALTLYKEENYSAACTQLQELREQSPFNSIVLRYLALSAMQTGDFYLAEQVLQQNLTIESSSQERAAATWYLALVYLRLEEHKKALPLLKALASAGPGLYAQQASELLRAMD